MADPTPTSPAAVDPGYTTTEFWQTLLFQLVAAIVAIGSVFGTHFNLDGLQSIVPSVAVVAAAIVQAAYSRSRATVKAAASAAGASAGPANPSIPAAHETNVSPVDGSRTDALIPVSDIDQSGTSIGVHASLVGALPPDAPGALTDRNEILADICVLLRRIYQEVIAIQQPPA